MKVYAEKKAAINTAVNKELLDGDFLPDNGDLTRRVKFLYSFLGRVMGQENMDKAINQLAIREQVESPSLDDKIRALHRLVFRGEEEKILQHHRVSEVLDKIEDGIADMLVRKTIEHRLEVKVAEKMEELQQNYMEELKLQILSKRVGPENAGTLRKYATLEKMEKVRLGRSAMEKVRPSSLDEIVGQERAVKALIAKLASPYPQHVLIYGPPGVGKTTAARLVLEMAKKMHYTPFSKEAKFVEVDGTTLRWDPRDVTNPLLGSVHDPIYQGAKRELADAGTPEPKLGLVSEAHGGVLFIDEIGELDFLLQNKLLKVLEDKRVFFDSSYYDPDCPGIPEYVKKLFNEGAPADFILIGATTRHPSELNPALRSRCAEVFFDPLDPCAIQAIVEGAAARIGVELEDGVSDTIRRYTIEGRKAVNLLTDAYGMALYRQRGEMLEAKISLEDLEEVIQAGRLSPYGRRLAKAGGEIGKILGLGVNGFLGSVIEFEAVAFPAVHPGQGRLLFNETAGSMAKDSVTNAAAVIRKLTGEDISCYDIHVNVIGGGKIDGPSAGAAIVLVILSAIRGRPIRQDIAITGEISIQGKVKPVGGVHEKIYGARMAGVKTVFIPGDNREDIPLSINDMEIITISRIEEAIERVLYE